MKNIKKKKVFQENKEYKYYKYDMIALIGTFLLGIILLMLGIDEVICIAFIFSFVIIIVKISSAYIFNELSYKIIKTISYHDTNI